MSSERSPRGVLEREASSSPAPVPPGATTEPQGPSCNPRILFATPEIAHVSAEMCPGAENIRAKAGGMADVSASLVEQLRGQGADIHLVIPNYRTLFKGDRVDASSLLGFQAGESRVHLAEDSAFYHSIRAYHGDPGHLRTASLAFQREIINHVIPRVQPDIVHCNDWMTGLIPAACKRLGIKTIFTIHNIHRERVTLAEIAHRGVDPSPFWNSLHYHDYPYSFGQSYHDNPIDMLASAIINADYVTTVSPTFLQEIMHGTHGELPGSVQHDLRTKIEAGYAKGILNAPPASLSPTADHALASPYTAANHRELKGLNKLALQQELGLTPDQDAPLLLWPSRLDPIQKGCHLLTHILHQVMRDYEDLGLQLAIVGDGPFKCHFQDIITAHQLQNRVAVADFDESLSRRAYAGADFVLVPSSFEPCGLPQMIGARYGTIPVVHNTGGLHDTVAPFSGDHAEGNGIVFDTFDSNGLRWALDRAMTFHRISAETKEPTITRIMQEANDRFSEADMFAHYLAAYTKFARDRSTQAQR